LNNIGTANPKLFCIIKNVNAAAKRHAVPLRESDTANKYGNTSVRLLVRGGGGIFPSRLVSPALKYAFSLSSSSLAFVVAIVAAALAVVVPDKDARPSHSLAFTVVVVDHRARDATTERPRATRPIIARPPSPSPTRVALALLPLPRPLRDVANALDRPRTTARDVAPARGVARAGIIPRIHPRLLAPRLLAPRSSSTSVVV
jgi:hypothetical protein